MIKYNEKYHYVINEIERQGHHLIRIDNEFISSNDTEVQKIIDNFDPLPFAKSEAKDRIKHQAELLMADAENSYPSFERQTWPYQRLEVEAWSVDNNAPTPTIDAIALSRGVDRIAQLNRTLAKVTKFKSTSNHLAGRRQYFEDLIDSSDDIDYINSLNFEA